MTENNRSATVTVTNSQGVHARPADMLVRLANQFEAEIQLVKDDKAADGKSILSVLMLAAEQGSEICIRASGRDADHALQALVELFASGFSENGDSSGRQAAE